MNIRHILNSIIPSVSVSTVPVAESVDSIVIGLNRTLDRLQAAARGHAALHDHHREAARSADRAAELAQGEANRANRIAEKIYALVG